MEDTMTGVAGARLGPSTDVDENSLLSVDGINFTSNWGFCSADTVTEIKITLPIILDGPWKQSPASSLRGPGFDTRSGNILSFLLPLFQEGQLSVTGENMCTKYWLTA